ncbi:hypothetical protein V2I01_32225 [Micromonospora sp. BRA006-A]|nr:hypothetical protein [Micromonospora sp. BRA006-A]
MDGYYPDRIDQQLVFGLLQMLWDRSEANGYAQHMTGRPLPGTPAHRVLMHVAFGDHQVSTVAEVQARTIGARLHTPALAGGWSPDVRPFWASRRSAGTRTPGRRWWCGTAAPRTRRRRPTWHPPDRSTARTRTEFPRAQPGAQRQKAVFLLTGR